jgi:predicted RNase H-like HicB family nuclease
MDRIEGRSVMELTLDCDREEDGRWLAEVPQLPGVLAYGGSADEAMAKAEVLALRVLAERTEFGEARPQPIRFVVPTARASASIRPQLTAGRAVQ